MQDLGFEEHTLALQQDTQLKIHIRHTSVLAAEMRKLEGSLHMFASAPARALKERLNN